MSAYAATRESRTNSAKNQVMFRAHDYLAGTRLISQQPAAVGGISFHQRQ